ncbi:hypothetical protein EH30_12105 [Erythrobacter sp. JL475]|jgi:hypothetical protein|nr:hypothetical protein EH30_12105 [Erythrobacter sp. JL475]
MLHIMQFIMRLSHLHKTFDLIISDRAFQASSPKLSSPAFVPGFFLPFANGIRDRDARPCGLRAFAIRNSGP